MQIKPVNKNSVTDRPTDARDSKSTGNQTRTRPNIRFTEKSRTKQNQPTLVKKRTKNMNATRKARLTTINQMPKIKWARKFEK